MPKFTESEWHGLQTLRLLCKEEAKFGGSLSFNVGMNVAGLSATRRAIKAGMITHCVKTDTIEWVGR